MFKRFLKTSQVRSPWLLHFDCGSCNGCDIETLACLTPVYDVERFGIINVGNPRHADVLVVTGTVNPRNAVILKNLYDQMPTPRLVIANVLGGIDKIIPVDVYVPGCPAKPEAIMDAVVTGLAKLKGILEASA